MLINSNLCITFASLTVFLFSFCFHDLSIDESGVLRSSIIIVWGAVYFLSFTMVSFMNMGTLVFEAYVKD